MVDYNKCREDCADYVREKDINECVFRRFCVNLDLPISKKEEENE